MKRFLLLLVSIIVTATVTACSRTPPQIRAEQRLFLPLSLEFVGEYQLPKTTFADTPVGGLSGLSYDRDRDRFYAISDDRSNLAPARFYTFKLQLTPSGAIEGVKLEDVTFLRDRNGETYPPGTLDTEGIALSPRGSIYISSEGSSNRGIAPFINEYNLETGKLLSSLKIPQRYLPNREQQQGVQNNLGFEALTLSPKSLSREDPFRLFTATESSLLQDEVTELQDGVTESPNQSAPIRLLHYIINPIGDPFLVAEHLYLLEPSAEEVIYNGLTELIALQKEGYFLSLERTYGWTGAGAKIFQIVVANATDTTKIASFADNLAAVTPLKKKILLDLSQLDIELDNLEGMTLGPRLQDGSRTLVLISDDNFRQDQVTQLLLFRLRENTRK